MYREQVREALIKLKTQRSNKENRSIHEERVRELSYLLSSLEGAHREGIIEGIGFIKQEIALKMIKKGYDVSTIAEITDLNERFIQKLES